MGVYQIVIVKHLPLLFSSAALSIAVEAGGLLQTGVPFFNNTLQCEKEEY